MVRRTKSKKNTVWIAGLLTSHNIQVHHIELLKIKIILPGLNIAEEQREEHGKSQGGRREVKQGEVAG